MQYVLAFLFGGAQVLAYAPFSWFPLAWLSLAALLVLAQRTHAGFRLGFSYGMGLFVCGVSWIYVSLHTVAGLPALLGVVAVILFAAVLALFPGLAVSLYLRLFNTRSEQSSPTPMGWGWQVIGFAACWTLGDWLRSWVLTGFPWLALGYSQSQPSPLSGYAPLFGVFGVSLLSAVLAGVLGSLYLLHRRQASLRDWAAPLGVGLVIVLGGGGLQQVNWTQPSDHPPLQVALLQGNVEQGMKWDPARLDYSLRTYRDLAALAVLGESTPLDLLVLPETAIPLMYDQVPVGYWQSLMPGLSSHGALISGIATRAGEQYFNSAVIMPRQGCTGECARYSKSHLVPFGEFIPPLFGWFVRQMNIPLSGFTPGPREQGAYAIAGEWLGLNICYEDVFGDELLESLPQAGILLNLSNTAWFGDSLAQPQHLQIARMRALETGRPMLRATNTGMTALINPRGEIEEVLQPFSAAVLRTEVQSYQGETPFIRWGNRPVVLVVMAVLLLGWLRLRYVKR